MYELGSPFRDVAVPDGVNLLVSGPPMTGKRELAMGHLARGTREGEGAIVVTTKESADRVASNYRDRVADAGAPLLGIVDCVTRQQGMATPPDGDALVRYASSPVDLTGIGIELSDLLKSFYRDRGITGNRVLLYSLSTLLMYSNLQTVFRFLHVFTGRLRSAEAFGLYVMDSTAHDDRTTSTLKQLFDGAIEVRETAGGGRECRVVGLPEAETDWAEF